MIWFFALFILLIIMGYNRLTLKPTFIGCGLFLAAFTLFSSANPMLVLWLWVIFCIVAIAVNGQAIRMLWLTKPALKFYRKQLPSMSQTEQQALEAGTTWWERELFSGRPDWLTLQNYPSPRLSEEEQAFIDGPLEEFCAQLDQWEINQAQDLPPEAWSTIKSLGLFGMIIPKTYGGLEFSAYAQSQVLIKIGSVSMTAANTVAVPNSLGPGELLLKYGTDAQKDHYLPRLATGTDIPCFGLTAPTAGSDAGAIPDIGIVQKGQWNGKEVLGMSLTWNKRYITLAPVASLIGLAFKLQDPDGLLGEQTELGITCALIPRDTAGVNIGRRHLPLAEAFQNGPTWGEDVFVPLEFIIGGPKMAGEGWRMLMECLSAGRAISLPSSGAVISQYAAVTSGAYAKLRQQFGMPIGQFEGVGEALGRLTAKAYMVDATRTFTVGAVDLGEKPAVASAIAKYHCTEKAREILLDAMDIHGGKGIMLGPNNYLAHAYQTAPIGITVEGANILTRSMILFGQGAIRCHPWILPEMQAAQLTEQNQRLAAFDQALVGHLGFTWHNICRSMLLATTNGRCSLGKKRMGQARRYYQKLNRYSSALALLADMSMISLGSKLKFKEQLSARLGDILANLYMASAVLKRFEAQGSPEEDLPLLQWSMDYLLSDTQNAIDGLLVNLPNRPLAWVLRRLVLPFGRNQPAASDKLSQAVAASIMENSSTRARLGWGLYYGKHKNNALEQLEKALLLEAETLPIQARVQQARRVGMLDAHDENDVIYAAFSADVITESELQLLEQLRMATQKIIAVDDFAADNLSATASSNKRAARPFEWEVPNLDSQP